MRSRGRPKLYDRQTALWEALLAFWKQGYTATSLDDLTTAMAMQKPRIYAEFGNKERLFQTAFREYLQHLRGRFEGALQRDGLRGFFGEFVQVIAGEYGPKGCLAACVLPAEPALHPALQAYLAGVADVLRPYAGENTDVVVTYMLGLAVRARGGAGPEELARSARSFLDALTSPEKPG